MRTNSNIRIQLALIPFLSVFGYPILKAQTPSGAEILENMTSVRTVENSKGVMTQTIQTSTGQHRMFELESYSANEGEKTLMRYIRPASIKGQAFLMLNNANDIWTYFPRSNRVRKLASHAKKQNVQGSDFTYEDMGSGDEWREKFVATNLGSANHLDQRVWELQLDGIPDKEPPYPKIRVLVRQKDYYPLQLDYYDDDGEVLKSLYLEDIREIEGIPTAMIMTMRNHQDRTETMMEMQSVTYQWEPPAGFFSERNLKQ
ncbi:MAG: outer membrane lipoprotein-sorting protein [Fidelibacterota bacterium]|nr:MAG: outer membrane lipoprotein-sorting protein [Candidatus Neomarinimicrobiota bacterium]